MLWGVGRGLRGSRVGVTSFRPPWRRLFRGKDAGVRNARSSASGSLLTPTRGEGAGAVVSRAMAQRRRRWPLSFRRAAGGQWYPFVGLVFFRKLYARHCPYGFSAGGERVNVERGGGGRSGQGGSQSRQRWGRCHLVRPAFLLDGDGV
jgi:hypothetical protein